MKIITTATGAKITIYGEAKEMPIARFNDLQKYSVIQSGIGHTMQDIDARYAKVAAFIAEGKTAEAIKELENSRFAILSTMQGVNYATHCFATFIKSIDGVEYNDLSDEGLDATLAAIIATDITQYDVEIAVEEVKKKSIAK